MTDLTSKQTHFSFYASEAIAGRQAERIADAIVSIHDAADQLCFGLDPTRSPDQLKRIELSLRYLRAELDLLEEL